MGRMFVRRQIPPPPAAPQVQWDELTPAAEVERRIAEEDWEMDRIRSIARTERVLLVAIGAVLGFVAGVVARLLAGG